MTATGGSGDVQRVIDHLVALCPPCRRSYDKLRRLAREFGHWDYTLAVAETREAPGLWQRLEALSDPEQLQAVEAGERFQTWGLCRLLQRMSGETAGRSPETASQLAKLAVAISRHLDAAYDPDWIHDLQALSLGYLGNAWRALGEVRSAADAFGGAETLRLAGTGYPSVEAEALALLALLRRDEHRLAEAAALFERVHALSSSGAEWEIADPDAVDPRRAGEARVHQAWCVYHQGHAEAALALLAQAERLLGGGRQAGLALAIRCGRTWCAIRLGRLAEANVELAVAAQLAVRSGDDGARLRLSRAGVRIAQEPAELELAEQALRAAAPELERMDLGVDAALVYFDLASLHLAAGAIDSVQALSNEVLSLFRSRELGKEGARVLLLFQQACQRRGLTIELAETLAATLERTRRPSLAWWSASGTLFPEETTPDVAPLGTG